MSCCCVGSNQSLMIQSRKMIQDFGQHAVTEMLCSQVGISDWQSYVCSRTNKLTILFVRMLVRLLHTRYNSVLLPTQSKFNIIILSI